MADESWKSFKPSDDAAAENERRSAVLPATALRKPEASELVRATNPVRTSSSCISKQTRVSGKIDFGEMATIEGEAEGEITGENIEIASSAVVRARIIADRLKIGGQVNGEIFARQHIEVLPTARLRCAITTATLMVAEGAQFDGDCKIRCTSTSSPKLESQERKEIGISFSITEAERAELRHRGYSDDDIALMIPTVAHRILGVK